MRIELTEEQKGILTVQQMDLASSLFNYGICIFLQGKNTHNLKEFCEQIFCDIPLFRGYIEREAIVVGEQTDNKNRYNIIKNVDVEDYIVSDLRKSFEIEKQLCHLTVIISSNETIYVYFKIHHLIFDGYSIPILEKVVKSIWNGRQNEPISLPNKEKKVQTECREYWNKKMADLVSEETFDTAILRTGDAQSTIHIEKEISKERLMELHQKLPQNISIKQYYVAALDVLNRLYGNHALKIGMPLNNRTKENGRSIGCFMNVLPMFFSTKTENTSKLLCEVREEIYHIFRNRHISLEEIKRLSDERGQLYNVTLSIISENGWVLSDSMKIYSPMEQQEDLTILIYDRSNGDTVVRFSYKETAFEKKVAERLLDHYISVVEHLIDYDNIRDIDYLSQEEKNIMSIRNETDKERIFVDVCSSFHNMANKYPDKIAVAYMDKKMAYQELDMLSDKLATYLRENTKESIVGIYMNRSIELIISIWGTLKAGFSYLPIDPTYPQDRVEYILEDSQIGMLLICGNDNLNLTSLHIPFLDMEKRQYQEYKNITYYEILPDAPAYVIYTSGSTGKPKGVVNIHKGLLNRLQWMINEIGYTENTVFLQKTPYSFDVSVWELILPFIIGAKLVVAKPEGHKDVNYLIDTIKQFEISTIHFVPSMFEIFLANKRTEECECLDSIICSGEGLSNHVAAKSLEVLPATALYNLYGPTEAAIDVTSYKVTEKPKNNITTIGKPIDNTKIYIVNDWYKLVPDGIRGQLLISGIGLAKCYHNRKDLTDQKFIKNPFSEEKNFERVYCSGDYARFDTDGNIIFMGRMDNQVKLNGQRVELGEIEQALRNCNLFSEVKVLIRKVGKINSLVVFYTAEDDIHVDNIKKQIGTYLPGYMVPNLYMKLEAFPLTPNGKLDVKYLSMMPLETKQREIMLPQTQEQKELLEVFKKILENEEIGIDDDFFEYGGDSLGAIQIVSEMPNIGLDKIYKHRTVKDIIDAVSMPAEKGVLKLLSNTKCEKGIICFPYGGGNPYAYSDMANCLPADWCLYAVDLPGHHYGDEQSDLLEIPKVTNKVIEEIRALQLKSVYLYGHCTGATIAYDVCKTMEDAGMIVCKLCVGATYPFVNETDSGYKMNNEEMYNFIKEIGGFKSDKINKQQIEEMLGWFGFDVEQAKIYFDKTDNRKVLSTPIVCITSRKDKFTIGKRDAVLNWEKLSSKVKYVELNQGEHYFITEVPDEVISYIID